MSEAEILNINDISSILFESAAEGLIVTDELGIIQISNPRVTEMFGFEQDELIGEAVEILIPKKFRNAHVDHRKAYNKSPSKRTMGIGMDLEARRKDGSTFPVEVSLNHFEVKGQRMIMALISDVTERKKADLALQEMNYELERKVVERTRDLHSSQQIYRLISRNFPNGVINVFDRDLNYVFVEGQELYNLGVKSERLVGTSYINRLDPQIKDDIEQKLMSVFDGNNISFEIDFRNNTYMLNAVGLIEDNGEVEQILVVEQNITQLKKAEEDIREALKKERELSEYKSRFVSMASHEFRTPLTTIQSSLALLKRYVGDSSHIDRQEKHINRIRTSVNHLTNILNDFLSIDKLEEGKVVVNIGKIEISKFVNEIIEELKSMASGDQQILYHHQGPDLVYSDPHMLTNILHNLISNALKYSGSVGKVDVNVNVGKDKWLLTVSDNGIGIPADEQVHLFDRFFRARNAVNIQGTGLGLSITTKYVDLLNGKMEFESEEGQGTLFRIYLPNTPKSTDN